MSLRNVFFASFLMVSGIASAQSIIKTADSKSGILVGTQDMNDFAGITYERGSDEFIFNYKFSKQTASKNPTLYPNSWGFNFDLGFDLDKNKSPLVSAGEWQGGLQAGFTISRTWDNTKLGLTRQSSVTTKSYFLSDPDKNYKTAKECADAEGATCLQQSRTLTDLVPEFISQWTIFLSANNEIGKIRTVTTSVLNADTTFANFRNPYQNKLTLTGGFSHLQQVSDRMYISLAGSLNFNIINRSTTALSSTSWTPQSGSFFSAADSLPVQQHGDVEKYYVGKTDHELEIIPRIDFFLRYSLGEEQPFLGIIASAGQVISSIDGVRSRNNYAVGPSLSLPGISDQVVFAIMSEWLESKKGEMKYALTFHASFPIKIK